MFFSHIIKYRPVHEFICLKSVMGACSVLKVHTHYVYEMHYGPKHANYDKTFHFGSIVASFLRGVIALSHHSTSILYYRSSKNHTPEQAFNPCAAKTTAEKTQDIDPMLDIVDGGPTLVQHWVDVSCLLGDDQLIK